MAYIMHYSFELIIIYKLICPITLNNFMCESKIFFERGIYKNMFLVVIC